MWRDPFDGSFYPRPPYGGRRGDAQARQRRAHVSILALHTEGDFKEFERLQAQLERPIGMWNCRHFAFPIILGVSEPAHSPELLENYRRTSREKITIDGATRTRYEWTQQQRKLETAVRRQKDIANTARAAGDDVLRREAQYKIERYQAAYKKITDKAMLTAEPNRMYVSGFRGVTT